MLEPGGQVAFMNPTAMELLGLSREEPRRRAVRHWSAAETLAAERFSSA